MAVDEWPALLGCGTAAHRARAGGEIAYNELRAAVRDAVLNPIDGADFSARAERLLSDGLAAFDADTVAWSTQLACAAKREDLHRWLLSRVVLIFKLQLQLMRDDALASFRADLAIVMADSVRYKRHAMKLVRRCAAAYEKATAAATPSCLQGGAATTNRQKASSTTMDADGPGVAVARAAVRRSAHMLLVAMDDEAGAHEEEAEALPPREQDVAPPPWWKQLLAQVLGIGLNLVQAYFLQHLPARHRDRVDERAVPRAPLF